MFQDRRMTKADLLRAAMVPVLVLTAIGLAPPVAAQGVATLEEVIVTAERRERNLQQVPISITALTGDDLDASVVENTIDLQYRTPGFVFKTNSIWGQPYIRGVGSDLITAGADPAVATFVDGVYQSRAYSALQDFFDVDRVEVVKGPQGTLYGRNATAGAINIISNEPQPEFGARGDILFGNYSKFRLRGLVNIPLVEDRVYFRASAMSSNRDGFTHNSFLGTDIDDEDYWAVRGQVKILASENVEIMLSGDFAKERSSRAAAPHPDPVNGINLAFAFGGTSPADPREITHDFLNFQNVDAWGLSAKIVWDAGPVTVTSITAYRDTEMALGLDLDSTEIALVINEPFGTSETFTQELQISSTGESRLEWLMGAFYLSEDAFQQLNVGFPLFAALNQPTGDIDTEAYALFGQATYSLDEKWSLTAGLRYSHESKDEVLVQIFSDDFGLITGIPGGFRVELEDSQTWDAWTPRFVVNYQATDDVMVYLSATRGFKAGGYNTDGPQDPFNPEFIWSYEAGFKSMLAGGRARFNAAAFYYDYTDIQLLTIPDGAPPGTFPSVINVPKARVMGLEAELFMRLTENFEFSTAALLSDAEFREFIAIDPNNPQLGEVDRQGAQMPQAPDFSITVAAEYDWAAWDAGRLTLRGEFRYQSMIFFNTFQDPVVSQDGYSLFNARLAFESANGRWSASVFVKNLTDKLYTQTKIRQDPIVGNLRFWGAPRTFGVQLGMRY